VQVVLDNLLSELLLLLSSENIEFSSSKLAGALLGLVLALPPRLDHGLLVRLFVCRALVLPNFFLWRLGNEEVRWVGNPFIFYP